MEAAQTNQGGETITLLTVSLSLSRGKNKKQRTIITVLTPLNVFLPTGLKFRNCSQAGCWIQHYVNTKLMQRMKRGKIGYAKMRLINGQNINVKFSLRGLSGALKGLKSGKPPKSS